MRRVRTEESSEHGEEQRFRQEVGRAYHAAHRAARRLRRKRAEAQARRALARAARLREQGHR